MMNKKNIIFYTSWLMAILLVVSYSGCDLPRDNPLDPEAYNYPPELVLQSRSLWPDFPFRQSYDLMINVSGNHCEDADSAYLNIFGYMHPLIKYNSTWVDTVESGLLYENANVNIFELVGEPLSGKVFYDGGHIETKTAQLVRVIEDYPNQTSPSGDVPISLQPINFIWDSLAFSYDFTLEFKLYIVVSNDTNLIAMYEPGLPGSTTNYIYPNILSVSEFYSKVKIRDKFGNTSESQANHFYIIQ